MFDDEEYRQLKDIYLRCLEDIKRYRKVHHATLPETPRAELLTPFHQAYEQITGQPLSYGPDEVIRRHYLSRWKTE